MEGYLSEKDMNLIHNLGDLIVHSADGIDWCYHVSSGNWTKVDYRIIVSDTLRHNQYIEECENERIQY